MFQKAKKEKEHFPLPPCVGGARCVGTPGPEVKQSMLVASLS